MAELFYILIGTVIFTGAAAVADILELIIW
jgi:hypothetical protein